MGIERTRLVPVERWGVGSCLVQTVASGGALVLVPLCVGMGAAMG